MERMRFRHTALKKDKSWDAEYLRELELQSMMGESSKEFMLHLVEVNTKIQKKSAVKKWIIAGIAVMAAAVILVIIL